MTRAPAHSLPPDRRRNSAATERENGRLPVERAAFALEMNISKTFPGVRALDDVTSGCARGEVHALCGENGAESRR